MNFIDRIAYTISPKWAANRLRYRAFANSLNGYVTANSPKKSMAGLSLGLHSPKSDIGDKIEAIRALSRDVYMTSSLGSAIIKRHKTQTICTGLKFQSSPKYERLGITDIESKKFSGDLEGLFDIWAESTFCGLSGNLTFGEMQGLVYLSLLLNGDFFWMPIWRKPQNPNFPYELTIKLIDADLVRDPLSSLYGRNARLKIENGVETNELGEVVAYHVWNSYKDDVGNSTRISVYKNGRQQIYHVFNPERFDQKRGLPCLANVAESLKQLTRLNEAEVMSALVSSFFTVFVKDATNLGGAINPAYQTNEDPSVDKDSFEQDLEMGYGNIAYVGNGRDITVANPNKTDADYHKFYDGQAVQACGGANIPYEQTVLHYTTSYTAARAADNAVWKHRLEDRSIISSKFCQPILEELAYESILRGMLSAPGYIDSYVQRKYWSNGRWIGTGRGYMEPLKEIKAQVEAIDNNLSTHEEAYTTTHGDRWDNMVENKANEEKLLKDKELKQTNETQVDTFERFSDENIKQNT